MGAPVLERASPKELGEVQRALLRPQDGGFQDILSGLLLDQDLVGSMALHQAQALSLAFLHGDQYRCIPRGTKVRDPVCVTCMGNLATFGGVKQQH